LSRVLSIVGMLVCWISEWLLFCQYDHLVICILFGMVDNDDCGKIEVNELILEEYGDVCRRFVELWNECIFGEVGVVDFVVVW